MKRILILGLFLLALTAEAQVLNGSFEKNGKGDLSNWEWTCDGQSWLGAPVGGGTWSIKVWGGNPQGCFPGFAYQKLPAVKDGDDFVLSGWAFAQVSLQVGIYFGTIQNGVIMLQKGATTTSTSWAPLSVESSFSLAKGDTAVVVLHGGIVGGPAQGYGYFDLIELQPMTASTDLDAQDAFTIGPNPFCHQTTLRSATGFDDACLVLYNAMGNEIHRIYAISGREYPLLLENLPEGIYTIFLTDGGLSKQFRIVRQAE